MCVVNEHVGDALFLTRPRIVTSVWPHVVGGGRASGKGGSSSKRTPGSTSRYDSSLGLLTKKFVDLLQVRWIGCFVNGREWIG